MLLTRLQKSRTRVKGHPGTQERMASPQHRCRTRTARRSGSDWVHGHQACRYPAHGETHHDVDVAAVQGQETVYLPCAGIAPQWRHPHQGRCKQRQWIEVGLSRSRYIPQFQLAGVPLQRNVLVVVRRRKPCAVKTRVDPRMTNHIQERIVTGRNALVGGERGCPC